MTQYNGPERREGMEDILTDVALIKKDISFINEKVGFIVQDMKEVKLELRSSESVKKKDLMEHSIQIS